MNILMGVTGSIAAYKAVEILRGFQRQRHSVTVIMTRNACRFIQPLTFSALVEGRVHSSWFEAGQDPLLHVNLGRGHELFLVAPASAGTLARMAAGMADDLLTATFLAFPGRVVVAPAMNDHMYAHPAVVRNLSSLEEMGVEVVSPDAGELACGTRGSGRLAEPERVVAYCLGAERV